MDNHARSTTAYHPALPDGLVEFDHQIAGHRFCLEDSNCTSILSVNSSDIILKPIQLNRKGQCEKDFYRTIWYQEVTVLSPEAFQLRSFIPQYFGCQKLKINEKEMKFQKLENLVAKFSKPCIIDIKIGAVTWDPLAAPAVIEHHKATKPHAFQNKITVLGYKIFDPQSITPKTVDKHETKGLDLAGLKNALRSFFDPAGEIKLATPLKGHSNYRAVILTGVIGKLEKILTWFEKQCEFHFYSSSLLLAYEMDPQVITRQFGNTIDFDIDCLIECKMIDFTHVFDGDGELDENYKGGLCNLIMFLKGLL